jgi:hypothetical protein
MRFLIISTIFEHFGEDAFGRGGHGHSSESKEKLFKRKTVLNFNIRLW